MLSCWNDIYVVCLSLQPESSEIPVPNGSQELYAITPSVLRHSVLITFSLNGLPWVWAVTYWEPSAQEFSMTQWNPGLLSTANNLLSYWHKTWIKHVYLYVELDKCCLMSIRFHKIASRIKFTLIKDKITLEYEHHHEGKHCIAAHHLYYLFKQSNVLYAQLD